MVNLVDTPENILEKVVDPNRDEKPLELAKYPLSPDVCHLFIDVAHMETPYGIAYCKCPFYMQPALKIWWGQPLDGAAHGDKICGVAWFSPLTPSCFFSTTRNFSKNISEDRNQEDQILGSLMVMR